jgi:hypothetical protein
MKPGELVRFNGAQAPHIDASKYDGKTCLVIRSFGGPREHDWVHVLMDGKIRSFRTVFLEVIDVTR